jgi:hypothetical protein
MFLTPSSGTSETPGTYWYAKMDGRCQCLAAKAIIGSDMVFNRHRQRCLPRRSCTIFIDISDILVRFSSNAKMYEVLRRTPEVDLPPNLFKMLQEIVEHCGSCQTCRSKEITFSSRLKGEAIFNRHSELDLFYLDSKPVLHVTDKDTKFGAARFDACPTKNPTTAQIWEAFCKCWALVYIGMRDILRTDRGTQFTARDFELALSCHGIEQRFTAVESHHSLGVNERAHCILRRVYLKTRNDHPNLSQELALRYSVKAINETTGPSGLVPVLLVYGTMPRYKVAGLDTRLLPNIERFKALKTARHEYVQIVNGLRVQALLKTSIPPAADRKLAVGHLVFFWREKEKRYVGPIPILNLSADGTQVTLSVDVDHRSGVFSSDCIRPAPEMADVFLSSVQSHLISFSGGDSHRACYTFFAEDTPVFVTESVPNTDPRAKEPCFEAAKQKELLGMLERGTFEIVLREDIPQTRRC